jgi:hypothetical protein
VRPGTSLAALLCGALLLPGCGGGSDGGKIPADQARKLISAVQAADQYNADGRCARAHTKVRDARFLLGQVPRSVDSDVRQGIADGLTRLDSLITSECQRPQQTQTETTPTQTETTQTQTTQTETTPTETTPTDTTQTQTTLTETTPTETTPTQTGTGTGTTTGGTGGTPPGQDNGAGAGADNQG